MNQSKELLPNQYNAIAILTKNTPFSLIIQVAKRKSDGRNKDLKQAFILIPQVKVL